MSDSTFSRTTTDASRRRVGLPARCLVAVTIAAAASTAIFAEAVADAPTTTSAEVRTATASMPSEFGFRGSIDPYAPVASEEAFRATFRQILSIPDDVLRAGDGPTNAWIDRNLSAAEKQALKGEPFSGACALAVGEMLIGFTPAGKLLKIKRLVKALGGVADAAKAVTGQLKKSGTTVKGKGAEKREKASEGALEEPPNFEEALTGLIEELLGIKDVKENCFSSTTGPR